MKNTKLATVLYFNDALGFGYAIDSNLKLVFIHFSNFKLSNNRTCKQNNTISYIEKTNFQKRDLVATDICVDKQNDKKLEIISNKVIYNKDIKSYEHNNSPIIIKDCEIDALNFENNLEIDNTILFINCKFPKNFICIGCQFHKNLLFLNCEFNGRFSLKNSIIKNSLHIEACNFRTKGGISLRGIKTENLYIDFGVKGPQDLIWINETKISKNLIINGDFSSDIEIRGDQDGDAKKSSIKEICIGYNYYSNQKIVDTKINKLYIENIISQNNSITNSEMNELVVNKIIIDTFNIVTTTVYNKINIENSYFNYDKSLLINNSNCVNRLIISECQFKGLLSLENSIIDKQTIIKNCQCEASSTLSLYNFITNSLIIEPIYFLYKDKKSFFNPRFKLLDKEFNYRLIKKDKLKRKELIQEYTSLKHWLALNGNLIEEDIAYFNMRNKRSTNLFEKLIFNYTFGWGVRLKNVLFSSIVLMLIFSIIYFSLGIPIKASGIFSFQSFFSCIFGDWNVYGKHLPTHIIPIISNIESAMGVIFITAFVGAYMRKLLR